MNLERAKQVADSVLYEGYLLYPYRATAVKNRQRFNFGVLLPPGYAQAQTGNDAWRMQTECLLEGDSPRIDVRVRFLQVVVREAGRLLDPPPTVDPHSTPASSRYEIVPQLTIDEDIYRTWQEAVEREVSLLDCPLIDLTATYLTTESTGRARLPPSRFKREPHEAPAQQELRPPSRPREVRWSSPPDQEIETLHDAQGRPAGVLVRHREQIDCTVTVRATPLGDRLWKLTIDVENRTPCDGRVTRDQALPHSLVAAHTILTAREGAFVSLLEPPADHAAECAACQNIGTWPVLLGTAGERDWMLSSPIILYDYPQIAAESSGSYFDGTEMDEMLALRVMTLTDDEKREMRNVDRLAREILERTESMPEEHLLKLHGTIRGLKPVASESELTKATPMPEHDWNNLDAPWGNLEGTSPVESVRVFGQELRAGDRVRLRPKQGADIMDLALEGKVAVIEAIERDYEDNVHLAVVVDDDPGRDLGMLRQPGHRFFFSPAEVEPMTKREG